MSLHNVSPGARAPDEFNVIIEIPMNADPIKYEVDHETGALFVDRFMSTSMHYPCNYGYIPDTLADDGVLARPTAWLFGSEAHGLPEDLLDAADRRVRVPIYGGAESLNLAAAAAVCLYASARAQR